MNAEIEKFSTIIATSDDFNKVYDAVIELGAFSGEPQAVDTLIPLLGHDNNDIVNAAALSLGELQAGSAVPAMVDALDNAAKRNNCNTLIYVLKSLNCTGFLPVIVKYFSLENYEVSEMITMLIEEQDPDKIQDDIRSETVKVLEGLQKSGIKGGTAGCVGHCLSILKS